MKTHVVRLSSISKSYKLYDSSVDRAKEALSLSKKKRHKTHAALKEVNLTIRKGEILGIIGRNGCGKSTLLKIIAGVLQPSSGTVEVTGKIMALLELGAGFNPDFTGIENIHFYTTVLGMDKVVVKSKINDIIAFAEIGEYIDQPIKTYSSGMRARLSFAVAIHMDPEILILDEVLSVGDVLFKRKCYAKMEELFSSGKTIIYVSHDAHSIRKLCTRAVLLHNSKIIMDGEPSEITKYYEKLLFSKPDQINLIIKEIAQLQNNDPENPSEHPIEKKIEDYIEGLNPSSTVQYGTGEATMLQSYFLNDSGEKVNILEQGQNYQYIYEILFKKFSEAVSFNFLIKSLDGITISGAALHKKPEIIESIDAGTKLKVAWAFKCQLITGEYFTNFAAVSTAAGEREFILRIVDADIFKVRAPLERSFITGLVTLDQKCSLEYLK